MAYAIKLTNGEMVLDSEGAVKLWQSKGGARKAAAKLGGQAEEWAEAAPSAAPEAPALPSLTELETVVLGAFPRAYTSWADVASDLGCSWTGAEELASWAKLGLAETKGALGSLVQKGLVHASDEPGLPPAQCLTELGCQWHEAAGTPLERKPSAAQPTEATPAAASPRKAKAPADPAVQAAHNAEFAAAAAAAGISEPRQLCTALRLVAAGWQHGHKAFVTAAEAAGLKRNNASMEYYAGRRK